MPFLKRSSRLLLGAAALCLFLTACGPEQGGVSAVEPSSSAESAASISTGAGREAVAQTVKSTPSPTLENDESSAAPPEEEGAEVQATVEIPVYAQAGDGETAGVLEPGRTVKAASTDNPLWYAVSLPEEGLSGWLYGESLYRVAEDGSLSSKSLFQEYAEEKLAALREQLPEGKYWNHMEQDIPYGDETPGIVTDIPCEHSVYGELYCNFYNGKTAQIFEGTSCQCLGFASFLSDQLFTLDAPLHSFYDYDRLRLGDHIRLYEYEHSMTVVEKTDEYVTVAEANENYEDCRISWSRQLTRYDLDELSWDLEYISRYPLAPAEDGTFTSWE